MRLSGQLHAKHILRYIFHSLQLTLHPLTIIQASVKFAAQSTQPQASHKYNGTFLIAIPYRYIKDKWKTNASNSKFDLFQFMWFMFSWQAILVAMHWDE